MTELTGQTLGRYQIVERLGRGGMADVYKAYQPGLDRYVAVKVMHPHLSDQTEFITRFKREAQAVAKLRHPNIIQVFDFDVQDERYFMAMEYVEGSRTLKEVLTDLQEKQERLSLAQILSIIAKVAGALEYAHHQGMIHRDVKPSNILIPNLDTPLLSDFGIARLAGLTGLTATNMSIGTPAYMAPELGKGETATEKTDIYALGIVLYECLTGAPPYEADTPFGVILKHINDPLPLPHKLIKNLPDDVERIVLKSLAKNPADRYANAGLMRQALTAAAEHAEKNKVILEYPRRASKSEQAVPDRFEAQTIFEKEKTEAATELIEAGAVTPAPVGEEVPAAATEEGPAPASVQTLASGEKPPAGASGATPATVVGRRGKKVKAAVKGIQEPATGQEAELPTQTAARPRRKVKAWVWGVSVLGLAGIAVGVYFLINYINFLAIREIHPTESGYEICNLKGKCEQLELISSLTYGNAAWSPDGSRFVFSGCRGNQNCGLFISDLSGKMTTLVNPGGGVNSIDPAWSPDGSLIAFHGEGELNIVDLAGKRSVLATGSDINCPFGVAWSPDSQWIAWLGGSCGGRIGYVFTINRYGSGYKQIYYNNFPALRVQAIAWAPDGESIVIMDNTDVVHRLFVSCETGIGCSMLSESTLSNFPDTWLGNYTPQWELGK